MSNIALTLEEEIVDILLQELGYRIQPWEAEEIAHRIAEDVKDRLSLVVDE